MPVSYTPLILASVLAAVAALFAFPALSRRFAGRTFARILMRGTLTIMLFIAWLAIWLLLEIAYDRLFWLRRF